MEDLALLHEVVVNVKCSPNLSDKPDGRGIPYRPYSIIHSMFSEFEEPH